MNMGTAFIISGLCISILINLVYFTKRRLKSYETRIFSYLLLANLFGLLVELGCSIVSLIEGVPLLVKTIFVKTYTIYLVGWLILFLYYVVINTFDKYSRFRLVLRKITNTVFGLLVLLEIFLPVEHIKEGNVVYASGPAVILVYIFTILVLGLIVGIMLTHINKIRSKKYYPLFVLILLGSVVMAIQAMHPELLMITAMEAYVVLTMYFTIENPDLKLMDNLYKSKEHAESSNNEKELFLFDMSQRIKQPIKDIEHRCEEVLTYDDIDVIKDEIREIDTMTKNLSVTINGLLGISSVESHNVEIVNNKYNLEILLKSIVANYKQVIEDKNLEFRTNIDNTLSEYLYGDSIRVKQIINIIMDNAVKYTEKGYIELDVKVINKYSSCRLMITVEDSGCGIESSELYKLLNKTVELDESGSNKIDDNKNDLITAKLLTSLIGGTIIASSEVGEGSKFTVILDQQIVKEKEDKTLKTFEDNYKSSKRIIVIEEDEKVRKNIEKALSKYDIEIDFLTYGVECLKKIRNKENYDLIIMSENLSKLSSYETMKKLLQIDGFNIPVLAMIEDNSILKDNYKGYGFTDTVSRKPNKFDTGKIVDDYLGGI